MGYKAETIRKLLRLFDETIDWYLGMPELPGICISTGNDKIGHVLNVSQPPIRTCANCSGCSKICYDVRDCLRFTNTTLDARVRNYVLLMRDRDEYFRLIDQRMSRRRKNKYFRWHVGGDIVDYDYFDRMVKNARNHPDFVIWSYTKNYALVNKYVREHGGSPELAIPANFTIMFSEWRGMPMDNPYNFPEFRVVFKDDAVKPRGFYCPGNCDTCKKLNRGCIAGEITYCNEH